MLQPDYSGFTAAINAIRAAQSAWDNQSPPEDPPEPPCMDGEIGDLMTGSDTDLITYAAFADEVDQEVLQDAPPGWITELLIRCLLSKDPIVKRMAETKREQMEDIAGRMLDKKWSENNG